MSIDTHVATKYIYWLYFPAGHIQYISTIVKDHTPECRASFGVQYLLDVIRIFYSSMGSKVETASVECLKLTEEEQQSIRAAILSSESLFIYRIAGYFQGMKFSRFSRLTLEPRKLSALKSLFTVGLCK